ncbi:hypothetical protein A4A49_53972 [Nicotiana attenuata]|uniref:Endonuclease/exonuclease/phosphatase domain-containing protein n=1 Tax=Nicotiana attenuata TaxID=49451 RepID=A0A1J6K4X9_NICAT|nr:hypothetical protein A4A49_53972 [Nicotiana attenuata]
MSQRAKDTIFWMTIVYAKTKRILRTSLWDSLRQCNQSINSPWCISGDFNVIVETEEKKGGVPHRMEKSWEFISCIEECGMVDAGLSGPRFTWCNGWGNGHRIWKRLGRVLLNHEWTSLFPRNEIVHLASTGSDHTPMLMKCGAH